jgi:hypothetical protein
MVISSTHFNNYIRPSFVLQAETEDEMREWMGAFEKSKRLMLQNEQLDLKTPTVSVVENNESSSSAADNSPPRTSSLTSKSKPTTMLDELPVVTASNTTLTDTLEDKSASRPSIVMLSTSPENDQQSLTHSTSLTPLLVWEASRASLGTASSTNSMPSSPATQSFSAAALSLDVALNQSHHDNDDTSATSNTGTAPAGTINSPSNTNSSWGIPWALVPSMFQSGNNDDIASELPSTSGSPNLPAVTDADGHQIIWPTRLDDSNVSRVDLAGYPASLDARNRELRHLFGGVGSHEVVLCGKSLF